MTNERKNKMVMLRIPEWLWAQYETIAAMEGEKVAVIHRRALKQYAAPFFSSTYPLEESCTTQEVPSSAQPTAE